LAYGSLGRLDEGSPDTSVSILGSDDDFSDRRVRAETVFETFTEPEAANRRAVTLGNPPPLWSRVERPEMLSHFTVEEADVLRGNGCRSMLFLFPKPELE
jgi:hypothetical protein